jgi:zinc transport system permease protein
MTADAIRVVVLVALFGLAAGLVGCFALGKRMLLASDVMSHLALPGLGLALLFHWNSLAGAGVSLLVGTYIVWRLQKKTGLASDAAIGVVFAAALALGALATPGEDLLEALFGNFRGLSWGGFVLGTTAIVCVILFLASAGDRLLLIAVSPDLAAVSGIKVDRVNLFFLLAFSATVLVGLRFLGALLSSALIIIPAATARQWSDRLLHFLLLSPLIALVSVVAGFALSGQVARTVSVGPAIVLVSAFLFLVSLGFAKKEW